MPPGRSGAGGAAGGGVAAGGVAAGAGPVPHDSEGSGPPQSLQCKTSVHPVRVSQRQAGGRGDVAPATASGCPQLLQQRTKPKPLRSVQLQAGVGILAGTVAASGSNDAIPACISGVRQLHCFPET